MTAEQFKSRKPRLKEVELDGDKVHVRKLSQAEVEHIAKTFHGQPEKAAESVRYVVCKCLTDDNGQRMYADGDLDTAVASIDFDDAQKIAKTAMEFSGLDTKAKGSPEVEAKNA